MGEFLLHFHASRATFGTEFTAGFYLVETHLFLSLFCTVCVGCNGPAGLLSRVGS